MFKSISNQTATSIICDGHTTST